MIRFLLIMVLLIDGQPRMLAHGFYARAQCLTSALSISESAREEGRIVLSADCYSVAPSWGLTL